jgi:hypothetical protein
MVTNKLTGLAWWALGGLVLGPTATAGEKELASPAAQAYPFVEAPEIRQRLSETAPERAAASLLADNLQTRFAPPPGTSRVSLPAGSFGAWLRQLPLYPSDHPVHLYTGARKPRQDVHAAVVALDVGSRDLQQCADAVMRLRAEYLLASGQPDRIRFHPDPGRPTVLAYTGRSRADFGRYLTRVFSDAGSASLQAELGRVSGPVQPGDVLIQGGHPGHAVQVLDVAEGNGKRYLLLGQSYMPAQQFHVLKNLGEPAHSPWYDQAALSRPPGLLTPEWWPFLAKDVRRFP